MLVAARLRSRMVDQAGAAEVVGVDTARGVIEAAAAVEGSAVRFEVGDIRALALGEGSFDVVVCFEVIDHLAEQEDALIELARVLKDDGVLLMSLPNRHVYPAGNPHHIKELASDELEALLRKRFRNVALYRQHDWLTSAVLGQDLYERGSQASSERVCTVKTQPREVGTELYTLAAASNAKLPEMASVACMTNDLEFRRWITLYDELEKGVQETRRQAGLVDPLLEEQRRLGRRLREAESIIAEIPVLQAQLEKRNRAFEELHLLHKEELSVLSADLTKARSDLANLRRSLSWRITKPLRIGKGAARSLQGSRAVGWMKER